MFTETNFDVTFPFSGKYNCNEIEHCIPLAKGFFYYFYINVYFDVYMKKFSKWQLIFIITLLYLWILWRTKMIIIKDMFQT